MSRLPVFASHSRLAGLCCSSLSVLLLSCSGGDTTGPGKDQDSLRPVITVDLTSVSFDAQEGGGNPDAITINVSNSGDGSLTGLAARVQYGGPVTGWIQAALSGSVAPATLTITIDVNGMAANAYSATVYVSGFSATERAITVTLNLAPPPTISLSGTLLSFFADQGGADPSVGTITVDAGGGGTVGGLSASVDYSLSTADGWLEVSLTSDATPSTLVVQPRTGTLPVGVYEARVDVSSEQAANSPQSVDVIFNVSRVSSAADVETLISSGFELWWGATKTGGTPAPLLSVSADAHTSSWQNFGMFEAGREPRQPFDNDPGAWRPHLVENPWNDLHGALLAARDGLRAILFDGFQLGSNGVNNQRGIAFARMTQGMAMGTLSLMFDRAWIIDENTDLEALELVPYEQAFNAAIDMLNEAENQAMGQNFIIPSDWVGGDGAWTSDYMVRFIRSWRARLRSQVARTVAERDGADWPSVLNDAESGLAPEEGFAGLYDGSNWAWDVMKVRAGAAPVWARLDLRMIGPADASGAYADWLATEIEQRQPFDIDTDDRRVTGTDGPQSDGTLVRYAGESPFYPERGTYHFSSYGDSRWYHFLSNTDVLYLGRHPDWDPKERDFLIAEARYRLGDVAGAMEIVNRYRTAANLPAFADPNGPAPGGDRCVPKPDGVNCGDLWEALKYEKRIELFHYGFGTEFFDDRGWGDLVTGTLLQLPIPGSTLLELEMEIYTYGGDAGGAAPVIAAEGSPAYYYLRNQALTAYREKRRQEGKEVLQRF